MGIARHLTKRYRTTVRIALAIFMIIALSGCISADYKSGNYWVIDEKSSTTNNAAPTQCAKNKMKTNGATSSSSQIIAPYFIPLFYLSQNPDKEIVVTIENQTCPELSIKTDNKENLPYTAHNLNSGHCRIDIPQPRHADKIIIQALNPKSKCEKHAAILIKKSFFCVRQTQFGGSPDCKKAL